MYSERQNEQKKEQLGEMRKECEKGKMIVKHDDSAFICLPFHSYPSGKN